MPRPTERRRSVGHVQPARRSSTKLGVYAPLGVQTSGINAATQLKAALGLTGGVASEALQGLEQARAEQARSDYLTSGEMDPIMAEKSDSYVRAYNRATFTRDLTRHAATLRESIRDHVRDVKGVTPEDVQEMFDEGMSRFYKDENGAPIYGDQPELLQIGLQHAAQLRQKITTETSAIIAEKVAVEYTAAQAENMRNTYLASVDEAGVNGLLGFEEIVSEAPDKASRVNLIAGLVPHAIQLASQTNDVAPLREMLDARHAGGKTPMLNAQQQSQVTRALGVVLGQRDRAISAARERNGAALRDRAFAVIIDDPASFDPSLFTDLLDDPDSGFGSADMSAVMSFYNNIQTFGEDQPEDVEYIRRLTHRMQGIESASQLRDIQREILNSDRLGGGSTLKSNMRELYEEARRVYEGSQRVRSTPGAKTEEDYIKSIFYMSDNPAAALTATTIIQRRVRGEAIREFRHMLDDGAAPKEAAEAVIDKYRKPWNETQKSNFESGALIPPRVELPPPDVMTQEWADSLTGEEWMALQNKPRTREQDEALDRLLPQR